VSVVVRLWRIAADAPTYAADDASGEGSRLSGGRWNRKGIPMLYCSKSRSLACLETVINLDPKSMPLNRYLVELAVPVDVWSKRVELNHATAPVGWDAIPCGKVSLDLGDQWAGSLLSAIHAVPSVIVPEETNFLINPLHPDSASIQIKKIRKWLYDPRIKALG